MTRQQYIYRAQVFLIKRLYIYLTLAKYIAAVDRLSNASQETDHTDHLGSLSVITDTAGNKMQETCYYPFGGTRLNTGNIVKHKYTGQEEDPETGLYFYNARYHDPILGRFISAYNGKGDGRLSPFPLC